MNTPFEKLASVFYKRKKLSQKDFFALLDAAKIPREICWRTIYRAIFDVKLEFNLSLDRKITRAQLEPVMKRALENARNHIFSEKALLDLIKEYHTLSFSVCHDQLTDVLNELGKLTKDFKSMSLKRQGKVESLESETLSVVESDLSIEDKTQLIKSKFRKTIDIFREDLAQLDQMTRTDHLTGLYNRRFFDEQMDIEASLAIKEKTGLNLLMIDIDDFKLFNDMYGHPIGDQALKTIAKNIQSVCHDESGKTGIDFFATRYGGEEFTVILPAVDGEQAFNIAEIIQRRISNYMFVIRKDGRIKHSNLRLTVSIGIATFNHNYNKKQGIKDLVENADAAMFEAKNTGKNCIKIIPESHL